MVFARLFALIIGLALPLGAFAQTATLLADKAEINNDNTIIATGNVEVLYGTTRLKAQEIRYDRDTDSLDIVGPITLTNGEGTVILADSAALSSDLRDGIITGARVVLNQQIQMASNEIARVEGRYTQLYKTSATSCQVCGKNKVPLWKIRSKKVIHDEEEQQLYFEDAIFDVVGVPVMYIPRLRLPDPTLERATGFLIPEYRGSSILGDGLAIPYFIALGDSADLTVAPYVAQKTNTVELRFRRAYRKGDVEFNGAVSSDKLRPNSIRGFLFGNGKFSLPDDYKLRFNVQLTSDIQYLRDYDYSNKDRLESSLVIDRTRNNTYFSGSAIVFRPLRGVELAIADQLPNVQGELSFEKRFFPAAIGGQASVSANLEGYRRDSTVDQIGRDRTRLSGRLEWGRNFMFGPGVLGRVGGELGADIYLIQDDSTYPEYQAFLTPAVEAELRWPLTKSTASGATMVLEPIVQLVWSGSPGSNIPNEDSILVEFDEGNLFQVSHFPGYDDFEKGLRATTGVQWTRYDPKGWQLDFALGKIFRNKDYGQFTASSGLSGTSSDWLAAAQVRLNPRLSIMAKALIDDDLHATKSEARLGWRQDNYWIATSYSWAIADVAENRLTTTNQIAFDGAVTFAKNWESVVNWRHDFESNKSTRTGIGLKYRNECLSIDLSLSRRFRSSFSVSPDTNYNFSVSLLGFGAGRRGPAQTCGG
ncbi:MAG: LPS-assembly protein LptD [Marinosulfonomonas sp.]